MGIKTDASRPTPRAGSRTYSDFDEITTAEPHKPLTPGQDADRRRATTAATSPCWFRGGGHKQRYRAIDFRRDKHGVPARWRPIEYDPNRSARIALLHYADGEKRYILWPVGLAVGATVISGETAEVNVGNALPLRRIPLGTVIHNIELKQRQGRPAGALGRRRRAADGARRATTRRSSCPRARCAGSTSTATPPSARSATSSTRTSRSARPAASAGWAAGRTTAACR